MNNKKKSSDEVYFTRFGAQSNAIPNLFCCVNTLFICDKHFEGLSGNEVNIFVMDLHVAIICMWQKD